MRRNYLPKASTSNIITRGLQHVNLGGEDINIQSILRPALGSLCFFGGYFLSTELYIFQKSLYLNVYSEFISPALAINLNSRTIYLITLSLT